MTTYIIPIVPLVPLVPLLLLVLMAPLVLMVPLHGSPDSSGSSVFATSSGSTDYTVAQLEESFNIAVHTILGDFSAAELNTDIFSLHTEVHLVHTATKPMTTIWSHLMTTTIPHL